MACRAATRAAKLFGAALIAGYACESPLEVRGEGERITVGRVYEQDVAGDTARRYTFVTQAAGRYAVLLEALRGSIILSVHDSLTGQEVGSGFADPTSGSLEQNATHSFVASGQGVYVIRVAAWPIFSTARVRFMVDVVNPDPEQRPAPFALGDTVTGETLATAADIDQFTVRGKAGQDVVAVAEALGPAGSGPLLLVIGPTSSDVLSYTYVPAGVPALQTSGRLRLATSGDYRFEVFASIGEIPRYRGPYRFWTYVIDPAPEHVPASAPIGSAVGGEAIDIAGDVDEFVLHGQAGDEFNVFLQASRYIRLDVASGSDAPFAAVAAPFADTSLFRFSTGRFRLPRDGDHTVRISGSNARAIADTGAYRFFIYPVDRRPEHVAQSVAEGDTVVGEAIDLPGDVDEFTFGGVAGGEFNVLFQAVNGSHETVLRLEAVDDTGGVLAAVSSVGSDTSLFQRVTGRFRTTGSGTHRLRVSGGADYSRDLGPYRLVLYRVHRAPERLPDTIAFGDSIAGESIDVPGDIDEFRLTVPASSAFNLVVRVDDVASGTGIVARLVDSATGAVIAVASTSFPAPSMSCAIRLDPGGYVVRFEGVRAEDRDLPYRAWAYRFGLGPEQVGDTLAIGDTVSGEAIDPLGDLDDFVLMGEPGQHIDVALQGVAATVTGWLVAAIDGPPRPEFVFSPTRAESLNANHSSRIDLPVGGRYRIRVASPENPCAGPGDRGAYRLAVSSVAVTPEQAVAHLAPGDSVTNEGLDFPGDWDEFALTGVSGQLLAVVGRTVTANGIPRIAVFDSVTRDTLAWSPMQGFDRVTPRFTMSAGGRLRIAVYEPRWGASPGPYSAVGEYRFTVFAVNPAPETVPVTFALGDTVRGESLFPVADVDEFTGIGIPGDTMSAWFRLLEDPVPAGGLIYFEIVDPATGVVLRGGFGLFASSAIFYSPGVFTVPVGGSYLIRVSSGGLFGTELGTAPYEFYARRGP